MGWLKAVVCLALLSLTAAEDYASNEVVQLFQQYLQINTTSGNDLTEAVEFWQGLAEQEGLDINVYEFTAGYPVIVIKLPGTDSSLGSIMLNSHMDVVPADEEDGWSYPPFSGTLDSDGVIWGRGTQDMKSVSIQHFEAIRQLKNNNVQLTRDVYMTLMPDEEVGADHGMKPFLASDEFRAMNVGVGLDEGTSFDLPIIPIFYQDKVAWQIQVDCYGSSAHSSTFPATNDTATGKCTNVINRMLAYRDEEFVKYEQFTILNAGAYTSVNFNKVNGGTANNVIASHVSLVFDLRLSITLDEATLDAKLNQWIAEAGDDITLTYILKEPQSPATRIDAFNPYWTTFYGTCLDLGLMVLPIVPPGSTDARFVRAAGYPVFGFSPMPNTELLLHSVDERVPAQTFLDGIPIFKTLVQNLANLPGDMTSADPSVYVISTTSPS